jgi:hypothetical protein
MRHLIRHVTVLIVLGLPLACAQPSVRTSAPALGAAVISPEGRELLNSERIERAFGSYGIEVLQDGPPLRVSNLYSLENGVRVSRTFAVVRYPDGVPAAVAEEHRRILAGGSIGAVFATAGWTVVKSHLHYGERPAARTVATLMRIAPGTVLAEHVYSFEVTRGGERYPYATLAEIHHPAYLRRNDLERIYGELRRAPGDAAVVEQMLAAVESVERE